MKKVSVYKLDSKGKQRIWTVWVEGNPDSAAEKAEIHIEAGLIAGKKVKEVLGIISGKNIGKSNQTTPYTQAVSEAKAKLELKLRGEYKANLEDVTQGVLRSGISAPMLAQKFHPTGEQKGSKTLEKMKLKGKKIHVQPKLDGNRCLIKLVPDYENQTVVGTMYTRKGDVMPVQLNHILSELYTEWGSIFWADGLEENIPEIILDGELFSTEMSFNELNGHLKRKDSQDPEALSKIKYHLYDIYSDEPYDIRYNKLKTFASVESEGSIHLVPSYEITATDEAIKEKLEEFLAKGHEGLMIRTLDKGYENKRTWQLCKVKLFEDYEAKLVDVELDKLGRLGAFIMEMPTPSVDRDGKPITTFKAGTTGITHEEGLEIIKNKEKYIGSKCTVEYFGLSEYLVPRFPKMKQLNREDI